MLRSFIYDRLISNMTAQWYAQVLQRLPEQSRVLDVGVGTGGALVANAVLVREKKLEIVGIDIDPDYVERARRHLRDRELEEQAVVELESVYDHRGGPYDAVYFSASFMLLPDPEAALRRSLSLLHPKGQIYFTQTIQTRRARWLESLKPMLKRLTTIDFGRVTYEEDFRAQLRAADLVLEEFTTLNERGSRAYCLAVARPLKDAR